MTPDHGLHTSAICQDIEKILTDNQTELKKRNGHLPDVFYIGLGKTGSSSITSGLSGYTTAHWHHSRHFETLYKTDFLTSHQLDIYDVPEVLGREYKYRPLIVECYREPLAQHLSAVFHRVRRGLWSSTDAQEIVDFAKKSLHKKEPLALKAWVSRYGVNVLEGFNVINKYCFAREQHVDLLFLRLEDSNIWPKIFKEIGYNFQNSHANSVAETEFHELYADVKRLYKFSNSELDNAYSDEIVRGLYTGFEIEQFKRKYIDA